MPFRYPSDAHERRHGPQGYRNYQSYRPWLRDDFSFRCVYCLLREQWVRAKGTFELDHFSPVRDNPGGALEYDNLLYCCASCNATKSSQHAPDPCQFLVAGEVRVLEDGRIEASSDEALICFTGSETFRGRKFATVWSSFNGQGWLS
jgi:HNH endonuclease